MPAPQSDTSSANFAFHRQFADALASRDAPTYLAFLREDCTLQINNAMPVYSRRAIEAAYVSYLESFKTLTVDILMTMDVGNRSAAEILLNYICNDDSTEVVACVYLIDRDETGLAAAIRVYGDGTRVFKPFMKPRP